MNPIDYNDLVKGDPFGKLIKEGEQLIIVYEKMGQALRDAMAGTKVQGSGNPATLKEAEDYQKLIDKIAQYEAQLEKTKKAKEKLTVETAKAKIEQQEYDKAIKETAKDELGLISAYQKESKTLNDMRKQYKDLVLTQGEHAKGTKDLLTNITALDTKLKKVDATVGQHQRNVGNYASSLGDVKSGLLEIGQAMGLAFGVTEIISFGKESVTAFLEAEKNATDLKNAVKGNSIVLDKLIKQSETLQDTSIFSDDDIQIAQKQLSIYGLTSKQVEDLTPKIVDFASKMGYDLATATDKAIGAINGQTKGLKESGLQFKDTGDRLENYNLLTKKFNTFQGASAEALETTIGKAKRLGNAWDNIKESIGEYLVNQGADLLDNFDVVFGKTTARELALSKQIQKDLKIQDAVNKEHLAQIESGEKSKTEIILNNSKYIAGLYAIRGKQQTYEQQQNIDAQIKQLTKFNNELRTLGNKEINNWEEKEEKKADKTKDVDKEIDDERKRHLDEYNKWADNENKNIDEADAKKKKQLKDLKTLEAKDYQEAQKMALDMQEKSDKDKEDDAKKEKARQKQERENAIAQTEMLYDVWKEGQERKNTERIEYIDHELEQSKSAIEIQAELASRGMENTLAFEMKKQADLEKARVQELERQKKVAKQQEALELSLAFLKAYETYISQDMKSGQALLRASADIFSAKLLSKAISGSAFEGVEDTGPGGTLDAQGGMLWKLHPHEGVVNAENNKKYKGAVGALNDGRLEGWAMDNIFKPQFNSGIEVADISKAEQVGNSITKALLNEMKDLKNVIKNKPENTSSIDNLGNVTKRMVENGLSKTLIKKTYLS